MQARIFTIEIKANFETGIFSFLFPDKVLSAKFFSHNKSGIFFQIRFPVERILFHFIQFHYSKTVHENFIGQSCKHFIFPYNLFKRFLNADADVTRFLLFTVTQHTVSQNSSSFITFQINDNSRNKH